MVSGLAATFIGYTAILVSKGLQDAVKPSTAFFASSRGCPSIEPESSKIKPKRLRHSSGLMEAAALRASSRRALKPIFLIAPILIGFTKDSSDILILLLSFNKLSVLNRHTIFISKKDGKTKRQSRSKSFNHF